MSPNAETKQGKGKTMTDKASMFFGGIPTAPDVRKIDERWPMKDLRVGDRMEYSDMEKTINYRRKTCRYNTVVNSWRKQVERETGKIIGTVTGEAFVVLSDSEKVGLSGAKLKTAMRSTRRAVVVASLADRKNLSAEECARVDHLSEIGNRIHEAARLASKAEMPTLE